MNYLQLDIHYFHSNIVQSYEMQNDLDNESILYNSLQL